jgi:F0F1-type ATP synthase membrane subunit c/vacuolar-type H+-ATPase subunit K
MKTLTLFLISGFITNPNAPDQEDFLFLADILTIVVGLICIIGIAIIGIQYLTAPQNSPKLHQTKRHLFEIIAGFVLYALIYALMHWLQLIFAN